MATPHVVLCPTCRRECRWQDNPFRPFCSERCKVVDIGAWATGGHRIPGEPVENETPDDEDESQS
jgi:endogenous inhibitor of DNA gyrase (YacG/DUF329 family)